MAHCAAIDDGPHQRLMALRDAADCHTTDECLAVAEEFLNSLTADERERLRQRIAYNKAVEAGLGPTLQRMANERTPK
jgi:hypothetical protein